ncbi:hypothetical protein BDFB_010649 [Asbolus verrucosus]|uniref:Uncharacterized protein n=1 Tax=Asbolus verrucosus TaxID=1661398 RepID=A0A482VT26_ASBVE|nr:hypothetical protein BDFB_010649 [Asbolus verrucosus]
MLSWHLVSRPLWSMSCVYRAFCFYQICPLDNKSMRQK